MLYLRRDMTKMISSVLPMTRTDKSSLRLIGLLILSSLPVVVVGLMIEVLSPSVLRLAMTVALANIFFAGWLYWADRQPVRHMLYRNGGEYDWSNLTACLLYTSDAADES